MARRPIPTPEERAEARRATLEQLHARLTDSIAKLESLDAWQQWLNLARSLHHYSFLNTLLILSAKPEATLVAGFGAWKERGHSVRKGEKAIKVLAPILRKVPLLDPAGNPVVDEQGKPRLARQMVGVMPVPVFDASQVEPPPATPPLPKLLTGQAPRGLWDSLAELVAIEGFTVTRGDCGTASGVTNFDSREVRVRDDVDDAQAVKTLAHEMGHVLTMDAGQVLTYNDQRELREVEAESIAYIVTAAHGLDSSQYTFDYVAGWAARAATGDTSIEDVISATGQRVIAAADRILAHTQPPQSIEEDLADDWVAAVAPTPAPAHGTTQWETVGAGDRTVPTLPSPVADGPRRAPGVPR